MTLRPLTSPRRSLVAPLLLSALLSTAMGCGFDFGVASSAPQNACTLSSDCSAGTCVDAICVEPAPEAMRVVLEVEPREEPGRALPRRWRFAPEVVVGPSDQDIVLPPGVELVGQVRANGLSVPADIAFTRTQEIPTGEEEGLRTRTYAEPSSIALDGGLLDADYASVLSGGALYEVTVTPTTAPFPASDGGELTTANQVLPPLLFRGVAMPLGTARWELSIEYADFSQPCGPNLRVGCTVFGEVLREGTELSPESGLQVRAVEIESGRVVSSLGITEEGLFAVAIAPDTGPWALRVSAGAERPLFPELTFTAAYDASDMVRITVPAFSPVSYSGSIETAEGVPVVDAQVQFSATGLLGNGADLVGRLQRTVITGSGDNAGEFSVDLLPGEYNVVVTPTASPTASLVDDPLDEPGILLQPLVLGEEARDVQGQVLVVPRRSSFGAQVWTPDGQTLPLEVEAIPLRRDGAQGLVGLYNRSATASSGPTGLFDLRLDLGTYDVIAKPPSDGAYPWVIFPGVSISVPGSASSRMVDIGMPVPRRGVVRDSAGLPLEGARVTAYVILNDGSGERAVVVARTNSDASGAFRLLLPSRLENAR